MPSVAPGNAYGGEWPVISSAVLREAAKIDVGDIRKLRLYSVVDAMQRGAQFRERDAVAETKLEREQDVVRSEIQGEYLVDTRHCRIGTRHRAQASQGGVIDRLADQQALGLVAQHQRDQTAQQADHDRGRAVELRRRDGLRELRADVGDQVADDRRRVLEQHGDARGILARVYRLQYAAAAYDLAEGLPAEIPRGRFEHQGHREHAVLPCRILARLGVLQMGAAFIDRHAAAQREDADGDDERPEIQLSAVAERVLRIRRSRGAMQPQPHQQTVAGVDERMDALGQHRRAAGDEGGDKFANGDADIADDGRHDGDLRFGGHRPFLYALPRDPRVAAYASLSLSPRADDVSDQDRRRVIHLLFRTRMQGELLNELLVFGRAVDVRCGTHRLHCGADARVLLQHARQLRTQGVGHRQRLCEHLGRQRVARGERREQAERRQGDLLLAHEMGMQDMGELARGLANPTRRMRRLHQRRVYRRVLGLHGLRYRYLVRPHIDLRCR